MSRKLFINVLFVFAGVTAGGIACIHPWQVWLQQRNRAQEQVERRRDVEKQREQFLREESRAKTNLGREELARANGWVRAGETPVD